ENSKHDIPRPWPVGVAVVVANGANVGGRLSGHLSLPGPVRHGHLASRSAVDSPGRMVGGARSAGAVARGREQPTRETGRAGGGGGAGGGCPVGRGRPGGWVGVPWVGGRRGGGGGAGPSGRGGGRRSPRRCPASTVGSRRAPSLPWPRDSGSAPICSMTPALG